MDLKSSSYHFHRELESPAEFLRREWKPAIICGGGFSIIMITAVMLVDPAFFYPRLVTDPLNYFLKAKALVETGSTSAAWAVNLDTFAYVSMPGIIRAPMIMAFSEFDDQLRGMQVLNVLIVAVTALMSAYILSWVLPRHRHWMAIVFAFAFTVLSPGWAYNVFLPMADAPYAVSTMGAILIAIELICSDKPLHRRPFLILGFVALFTLSFLIRFTAPVLLVFVAILAVGRWQERAVPMKHRLAAAGAAVILLGILTSFNLYPIFGRYFSEPFSFVAKGDKPGMLVNLLGAAIPSQVVPSFQLGFMTPPIVGIFRTSFSTTLPNMAWAVFGILISSVIIAGMWNCRRKLLPEIGYLLAALPVMTLMMPSTSRYLMPYQALFWIFFYVGAAGLIHTYAPRMVPLLRSRRVIAAGVLVVCAVIVGLRAWRVAGTKSERSFAVSVNEVRRYVADVGGTFRSLRGFVETLPPDRALLIGPWGTLGRWYAISNRRYYFPDSALATAVRDKDVYLMVECGTLEPCQGWEEFRNRNQDRVLEFGRFEFDSVFAARSPRARAEVFRVRNAY